MGWPPCCADDVAASPSTSGWPRSQRASPLGHPKAARELLEPGSSSEQSNDEPAAFPRSPAMAPVRAHGGAHNEERAAFPQSPAGTARAKAQAQGEAAPRQRRGASAPRRGVRRQLVPACSPQQGKRSSQGDAEPQARPLTQLQRPAALMQLSPGTGADLQVHARVQICIPLALLKILWALQVASCADGCLPILAVTTAQLMSMWSIGAVVVLLDSA